MAAAWAAFSMESEALPAVVAGCVGIVSALVFLSSSASKTPSRWRDDYLDDDDDAGEEVDAPKQVAASKPDAGAGAVTTSEADAGSVEPTAVTEQDPSEWIKKRAKALSPEQEARLQEGLARLPPESKKAIADWLNEKDTSPWVLLGLNCLMLVIFLGAVMICIAAVIGYFQINIFDLEVWRKGASDVMSLFAEENRRQQGRPAIAQPVHHDLGEL
eukprot:TRINITY_DN49944_c0_g1_i1.p1 TRINITY_DN49944_c0_g1~~TRINITY_DN49944_c0_g1_i1.p1  ORF type:complete len:216 (+),score=60.93 TRINITY_DN49944_c0_g1_i1:34-681(+)